MVSEFRALRASVMRLWAEAQAELDRTHLEDVTRFNEAIDQALAESMARYTHDVARSKDLFLGVLGHDLRNPLGAIIMAVTVMMAHEGPAWPHLKTATRILNAGGRMELIISDLLDFTRSRLGAGVPITRVEMDLVEICQETIDEIAAFHPTSTVVLDAAEPLRGEWDRGRIGQALSNLIGNAYQHGQKDTPITVVLRGAPATVTVTVHNQGRPIPPQHLHDIFDPFRQVASDGAEQSSSIGLGLFIVKAIVTAHDGTIDVTSTDAGTTFTVQLPRHAASDGQALLVGK
jgi:signal transduction histidine kinase